MRLQKDDFVDARKTGRKQSLNIHDAQPTPSEKKNISRGQRVLDYLFKKGEKQENEDYPDQSLDKILLTIYKLYVFIRAKRLLRENSGPTINYIYRYLINEDFRTPVSGLSLHDLIPLQELEDHYFQMIVLLKSKMPEGLCFGSEESLKIR